MFSSVGWGEILVLVIVGIVVVGPERLPRIINDVKAMVLAARNAISSAKEEMGDDFKEDFEDFRKPLAQLNDVRRMGARGLVGRALLDDDPEFLRELKDTATGVTGAVGGRAGARRTQSGGEAPATPRTPDVAPAPDTSAAEPPVTPASAVPAARPQKDEASASAPGAPAHRDADGSTAGTGSWGDLDDGDVL